MGSFRDADRPGTDPSIRTHPLLVDLEERRRKLKLTVPRLDGLPNHLNLRARHREGDQVPREGLQRVERHRQDKLDCLQAIRPDKPDCLARNCPVTWRWQ